MCLIRRTKKHVMLKITCDCCHKEAEDVVRSTRNKEMVAENWLNIKAEYIDNRLPGRRLIYSSVQTYHFCQPQCLLDFFGRGPQEKALAIEDNWVAIGALHGDITREKLMTLGWQQNSLFYYKKIGQHTIGLIEKEDGSYRLTINGSRELTNKLRTMKELGEALEKAL